MLFRYKHLRRRCQSVLNQIRIPRPFEVEAFCGSLAESRGRPLHLHPLPAGADGPHIYGMWLATSSDDHIFAESRTSRPHWEHIVMHEIAHMLFDHHRLGGTADDVLSGGLVTDLAPGTVRRILARSGYSTEQEQEAEFLASLMCTAAARSTEAHPVTPLGELRAALGFAHDN